MKFFNIKASLSSALFIIAFFILNAYTMRFPVDNPILTSTFGESRGDHFHTGIDFKQKQPIYPAQEGEVIFYRDYTENPTIQSGGMGNYVVMEHSNRYRTYYCHLQDGSINRSVNYANENNIIGMMGNSGRSTGVHLHFAVENIQKNEMINPLSVLPEYKDNTKPDIVNMCLKTKKKLIYFRPHIWIKRRKDMRLFVKAWDIRPGWGEKRRRGSYYPVYGVKRVTIKIDGEIIRNYNFERLIKMNDRLFAFPDYSFDEVYGERWYYEGGEFTPQKRSYRFTAIAEDWQGNKSSRSYKIYFK